MVKGISTEEFLNYIHGNTKIHFRVIAPKWLNTEKDLYKFYGSFSEHKHKLRALNELGFNIYYKVNAGGTTTAETTKLNALFADFDIKHSELRSTEGDYSMEMIYEYKLSTIDKLKNFILPPSGIVETRNGLHAYWKLMDEDNQDVFNSCIKKLISILGADPQVSDVPRILRLPGFNWTKTKEFFMCKVLQLDYERVYTLDEINSALSQITEDKAFEGHKPVKTTNPKKTSNPTSSFNTNAELIRAGKFEELRVHIIEALEETMNAESEIKVHNNKTNISLLSGPSKTTQLDNLLTALKYGVSVKTNEKVHTLIHTLPLHIYLNVPDDKLFNCILGNHEDKTPSANLYTCDDGKTIYHCFGCGASIGIIKLTSALLNASEEEAYSFLKNMLNITDQRYVLPEELSKSYDWFVENITDQSLRSTHPNLYKLIRSRVDCIPIIIEHVKKYYCNDNVLEDGRVAFYISRRDFSRLIKSNSTEMTTRTILLFSLLGIMRKLHDDEIPNLLLENLYAYKRKASNKYRSNVFAFPNMTSNLFDQLEKQAIYLTQKGLKISNLSLEFVLRTFGEEFTNQHYPQHQVTSKEKILTVSNKLTNQIAHAIAACINSKGYALEQDIILQFHDIPAEQIRKQLSRSIEELCQSYCWKRIRSTKELKIQLGIPAKGYPFIIVRN